MDDYTYKRVGLCLPPELHRQLLDAAAKAELPVSTYTRQIVAKAIRQPNREAA